MPHDYPVPQDVLPPKPPKPPQNPTHAAALAWQRQVRVFCLQTQLCRATPAMMDAFVRMPCPYVYVQDYDWPVLLRAVELCRRDTFARWLERMKVRDAPLAVARLEAALHGKADPVVRLTDSAATP